MSKLDLSDIEITPTIDAHTEEEKKHRKRIDNALATLVEHEESLTDWEFNFMEDIMDKTNRGNYRLTPKQEAKLLELAEKWGK